MYLFVMWEINAAYELNPNILSYAISFLMCDICARVCACEASSHGNVEQKYINLHLAFPYMRFVVFGGHTHIQYVIWKSQIYFTKGNIHWKSYAYVTFELYSIKQMLLPPPPLPLLLLIWILFRPISVHVSKYSRRFALLFVVRWLFLLFRFVVFSLLSIKDIVGFSIPMWWYKPFPFVQFISRPSTLITCHLCNSPPQKKC